MSFYDPSYFTIYDLIDSLSRRRQQPAQQPQRYQAPQYLHPIYPNGYYQRPKPQQQPYYYFNIPQEDQEEDDDEYDDEEEEESRTQEDDVNAAGDLLYRSLYGDGPYRSLRSQQSPYGRTPVKPQLQRRPSLPRAPHPAESAVDLLNLLGINLPYPEEELPTRKNLPLKLDTETPTPEETVKPAVAEKVVEEPKAAPQRPSIQQRKKSILNLHASAPSPKLDPLQVSKPQLNKNLPFSPPINVYDMPENYLVVVSIPGSDKNSFHVDFHPTSHDLVVKGEIKNKYHDADIANDQYIKVSEQRFGSFERNIKFPTLPKINDDLIKAVYNNGLLEVTIPKILKTQEQAASKRRITIEEVEDEELKREEQGL